MRIATRNKIFATARSVLFTLATLCLSGSLMQNFLLEIGVGEELVSLHTSLLFAANIGTTVLLSRWADRGNIIRRCALTQFPIALLFLPYLPMCIAKGEALPLFLAAAGIGIVQTFFVALATVCDYKLPYRIIPVEEYGSWQALVGILSAAASIGAGALATFVVTRISYPQMMLFCFILAGVFTALGGLCLLFLKPVPEAVVQTHENREKVPLKKVFTSPIFYRLAPANLLRGFNTGILSVMAVVASSLGCSEETRTLMVSVGSAAMLLGCLLFGALSRKTQPRLWILLGSLSMLALPLALIPGDWIFLGVYAFTWMGKNIVDYAVPTGLYRAVPDEIAGPYHAWRLILQNAGTLLATSLGILMPTPILLAVAALAQALSGLSYFWALRPSKREYRLLG